MRRIIIAALAASALWAAAAPAALAGGGGCHSATPESGTGSRVTMDGNCFTPAALWVEPGASVLFVNDDVRAHHVLGWRGGPESAELRNGMSYEFTFTVPGIYPYACWLHPGMTGVVVVGQPALRAGPIENAGESGEVRSPEETKALDTKPVASSRNGAVGGAAAIAGAALGTIGFVIGRRRRDAA